MNPSSIFSHCICVFAALAFQALSPSIARAQDANSAAQATSPAAASTPPAATSPEPIGSSSTTDSTAVCRESVELTTRLEHRERLKAFCARALKLPTCTSAEGRPIQHIEHFSDNKRGKRILVLGLMHGDEPLAGELTLEWAERLLTIESRNSWRVVPLINPDGLRLKTRMNARGVDLNRNFPTKDWTTEAENYWKKNGRSDPRRFPGEGPASEPETKCAISHIDEFKPDFIVSIHTPYRVLDFDGPRMPFPTYPDLPWRALGNFPGSLGRYMWKDAHIPVLTVELGDRMVDAAKLQDIIGTFAIDASTRAKAASAKRRAESDHE